MQVLLDCHCQSGFMFRTTDIKDFGLLMDRWAGTRAAVSFQEAIDERSNARSLKSLAVGYSHQTK